MPEVEVILEYKGEITFERIELMLKRLRKLHAYRAIKKSVRKRIYSIYIECIENIYKHAVTDSHYVSDKTTLPYILLGKQDEKYIISTGNVISNNSVNKLRKSLEQLNQLDKKGLKESCAEMLDKEFIPDEKGAGLGWIIIATKAESKIKYNFTPLNDRHSYFEINLSI